MIATVCDHESRRDSWFKIRLVFFFSCLVFFFFCINCFSNYLWPSSFYFSTSSLLGLLLCIFLPCFNSKFNFEYIWMFNFGKNNQLDILYEKCLSAFRCTKFQIISNEKNVCLFVCLFVCVCVCGGGCARFQLKFMHYQNTDQIRLLLHVLVKA